MVALGLDLVVLVVLLALFGVLVDTALEHHLGSTVLDVEGRRFATLQARYHLARWLGSALLVLLYFSLGERSRWRGTPGKRALGCRVVRADGERAGLLRLLWRNSTKVLSAVPCFMGFTMAVLSAGRRTLHDLLSGCRVVVGRR